MDSFNISGNEISESSYFNRRQILRSLGYGIAGFSALSVPGFIQGMNGMIKLDDDELKEAFKPAIGDFQSDL